MPSSSSSTEFSFRGDALVDKTLARLYRHIWNLCAGWNRTPFLSKQLHYIRRRYGFQFNVAPLGTVQAISMMIERERYITLNRNLFPRQMRTISIDRVFSYLDKPESAHIRFILLHELAHIYLHADAEPIWTNMPSEKFDEVRWQAGLRIFSSDRGITQNLIPEMVREIEADFFALIAMVPDFIVLNRRMGRSRDAAIQAVSRYLWGRGLRDAAIGGACGSSYSLKELATYRVDLFDNYAHLFSAISSKAVMREYGGLEFDRPQTLDESDLTRYRSHAPRIPVTLSAIAKTHPMVRRTPHVERALTESGLYPFDYCGRSEWPHSPDAISPDGG